MPIARAERAEATCRSVLGALLRNADPGWTYAGIARQAGVAKTTAIRYLKPHVWEVVPADAILRHRERAGQRDGDARGYARFLNSYYVQLLRSAVPLGRDPGGALLYRVNTSRFVFLEDMARRHGWAVSYDARAGRPEVHPLATEAWWNVGRA